HASTMGQLNTAHRPSAQSMTVHAAPPSDQPMDIGAGAAVVKSVSRAPHKGCDPPSAIVGSGNVVLLSGVPGTMLVPASEPPPSFDWVSPLRSSPEVAWHAARSRATSATIRLAFTRESLIVD